LLLISYFDRSEPVSFLTGNLPHWRQKGKTYFVTFRLADSLPQDKLRRWKSEQKRWLASHLAPHTENDRAEYFRLFTERIQNWLDADFGCCILARPKVKSMVEEALDYFDRTRYALDESTVPNHVHVLVTPLGEHRLSGILHSWKSFTAKAILRNVPEAGSLFAARGGKRRDGASTLVHQVWQKESFDHIVRSPAQLDRIRRYIRDNSKALNQRRSRSGVPPLDG
jgi:REP element-mobilizing transposase RayT